MIRPGLNRSPTDAPSAVFARGPGRDTRLTQLSSPWTMVMGAVALVVLAGFVFASLSQARTSARQPAAAAISPNGPTIAPGAPVLAQNTLPTGEAQPVYGGAPAAVTTTTTVTPAAAGVEIGQDAHLRAPAMVVDIGGPAATTTAAAAQAALPGSAADASLSADERFAARVADGSADTVRATQLRDLTRIIPQGTMIPAVLETAINSDLPGSVRAVISRDVRSYDGSRVLIPRGSKLIGQYKSAAAVGQTRAFVVWSRLLTPAGISVDIGSPATDQLGRGGLSGKVDNHYLQRFGGAVLLTVMSAGAEAAVRGDSGTSNTLIIGSGVQTGASSVTSGLQSQINIPVTIKVAQGAPVQVAVARDLDFSGLAMAGR